MNSFMGGWGCVKVYFGWVGLDGNVLWVGDDGCGWVKV